MVLLGLDPSFTNTGLTIIDSKTKVIKCLSYGSSIGDKTFANLYKASVERTDSIVNLLKKECPGYDSIITETPPPSGSFGSGLYGLDILLIYKLNSVFKCPVYGVAPTYIGHIHGTRKYSKTDSVNLALSLIHVLANEGFIFKCKGRFSNDMAESFLMCLRLYVAYGLEGYDNILLERSNYANSKEFQLCTCLNQ